MMEFKGIANIIWIAGFVLFYSYIWIRVVSHGWFKTKKFYEEKEVTGQLQKTFQKLHEEVTRLEALKQQTKGGHHEKKEEKEKQKAETEVPIGSSSETRPDFSGKK